MSRRLAILPVLITAVFGTDYFQQEVAYEIHVSLNDTLHTLSATESIVYTNNSPDELEYIWFHLWPNAYKDPSSALEKQFRHNTSSRMAFAKDDERGYIDSLNFTSDGKALGWSYHPEWNDVAKVVLNTPLKPGQSVTIETPFFVKLPKVFSRLGHTGKHYEITQWYPKPAVYDRQGWHPIPYLDMGEFYSEFGTFDVFITLNADYRVMATGDILNGEEEYAWLDSLAIEGDALYQLDKKERKKAFKNLGKKKFESNRQKTLHFHQEKVHDFAWFADKHWIVRKGGLMLGDSTKTITLWSMYLPKNAELWENSVEYIHDAGYWYSEFYGDYPYNHITAVDGDMSAGGGMEYPNITVISSGGSKNLLEMVIMHEVGHNWFYGILGSNERNEPWLDEGINEYSNLRYWEKKYGVGSSFTVMENVQKKIGIGKNLEFGWITGYMGYIGRANQGVDQALNLNTTDYAKNNYGSIVYGKTGMEMRFLQHYLGEEKMDQAMQYYYETWKYKHPTESDLIMAFNKNVNEDLTWFWQDAIGSTKTVDYGFRRDGNALYLENKGSMSVPVEIAFYDKNGREIDRKWIAIKNQTMPLPVPSGTDRTVIDPQNYMADVNRSNNATSRKTSLDFVFNQPTYYNRNVYWMPWLFNGNQYNGWTPGVMVYTGYIPGYRYGFGIRPMWDYKNSKLIGSISAERSFFKLFGFQRIQVVAKYLDYSGAAGWRLGSHFEKIPSIFSNAKWKYTVSINNRTITGAGVDSNYYDAGTYTTGMVAANYYNKPSVKIKYTTNLQIDFALQGGTFSKWSLDNKLHLRWTKKEYSVFRIWTGGFLSSSDVPKQFQIYPAGGLDPDFESTLVLNRTSEQTVVNIYDEQFIEDGPGLRGRNLANGTKAFAWGFNFTQDVPFIPVKLFADLAHDANDQYTDAGILFGSENMGVYLPLYQSWDINTGPTDREWIIERARFAIKIPTNIIRF